MKQLMPWIPAPCKATAKRFSRGHVHVCKKHRHSSSRSFCGSEHKLGKLYDGTTPKLVERFAIPSGPHGLTNLDAANGELRLQDNLAHIKLLYQQAENRITVLKNEVDNCMDELLRARVELDLERKAKRSAETRLEVMSSTVRELERVVDAQKDYIQEMRFAQRLKPQSDKPIEIRAVLSESNGRDGSTKMLRNRSHGPKQAIGKTTSVIKSSVGVQTARVSQNQSVQTRSLTDRHAQTAVSLGDNDTKSLQDLDAERKIAQSLRSKLMEYNNNRKSVDSNGSSSAVRHSMDDKANRGDLAEILTAVQKLEDEVGALTKRVKQQKSVNGALKQYFRTLESSYVSLFT